SPAALVSLPLRRAGQAGLDEPTMRAILGGTMAALLDGEGLPASTPPRRGSTITLSGRLARVYGYASLVGPALFARALEQAGAMLARAVAARRGPEPGADGDAPAQR